jgi:crotonobetainyl-CoA:carnitine CoA-transferase CaiB-like acyl-CoA transferase
MSIKENILMAGPLDGIRVFDLTRILAGPSCTQMLADLGADVIKIERAGAGDDTRQFAPPFIKGAGGEDTRESAYFCAANRNKRSVTLDISKPEGQALAKRMIAKSHVLVENFKTGGLANYGLSYAQLKDEFPGLIYCSITGFGQTGPYALRPGYDVLIQAMSGFMSLTGEPEGEPMKSAVPVADLMAGMYAGVAINAALRHREATGEGQNIDIGMLDVMVAFSTVMGMNYLSTGELPKRLGNQHPNIVPYQAFDTSDGAIILAVGNDAQYLRFCEFAGVPELVTDERFNNNRTRLQNRDELITIVKEVIAGHTTQHWIDGLEKVGVSCGPINNLEQVFNDPHVIDRGMQIKMAHPATGDAPVNLIGSPMRLSETPTSYRMAPPLLGQHTDEVLSDVLGVSAGELAELRAAKVI